MLLCRVSRAALGCLLLMACLSVSHATVSVDTLKAAYVYNIAKFVNWPAAMESLAICVLSERPQLISQLETLDNKRVADQVIGIRRISAISEVSDIDSCNIVYIDNDQKALELANQNPGILTISEKSAKDRQTNGVVTFYVVDNRLMFEIDLTLINKKKISISSKLLRLANRVRQ